MSNSLPPIKPVLIMDPRFNVAQEKYYTVLKSASQVNYRTWTTNSISTSNINFSCPPPNGKSSFVDRKILYSNPIRGTYKFLVQPGYYALNDGYDAPRAFPIHSSLDVIDTTINGSGISMSVADVFHALIFYNTGGSVLTRELSFTPTTPDLSQNYSDLVNTIQNPLASSGNYNYQGSQSRGSFSYTIVSNPYNDTDSPLELTAIIDMYVTEEIMLSPYYFGEGNGAAFYNVTQMDFTFKYLPGAANRVWSHSSPIITVGGVKTKASEFISSSIQFSNFSPAFSYSTSQPLLQIAYLTLNGENLNQNSSLSYPYYEIVNYPTNLTAITSGNSLQVVTNNIQLGAIPRKMYIFTRVENSSYYASPERTDTFYSLESLSINYCNSQNLLSNATKQQLYEISKKNGCNMSWSDWSGDARYLNVDAGKKYGGIGSVFCAEFGTDIELEPGSAPGIGGGNYNLYVKATVRNCNTTNAIDAMTPTLYIVVVYDAVFNIPNGGTANKTNTVLTHSDVRNALPMPGINYDDTTDVTGGNIFTGAKKLGEKIIPYAKQFNDFLKEHKLISKTADLIHDYSPSSTVGSVAKVARDVAESLGYGAGVTGGREMSRKQMLRRLNNF